MGLKRWLSQISIPVYFLVMFFAVASWIDINGLFVELPLMVWALPEGWALPSYMSILIQVANVGPLAFVIANRCAPNKVKEWPVIYLIIGIGALSILLLVFFWKETTVIAGSEHSTAFLTLVMFLALVDTTSSVVFLPYMAIFKSQYLTSYYIGEGLSGLIPGLVSLIQGLGSEPDCQNISTIIHNTTTGQNHTEYEIIPFYDPPRFSVETFFYFLFAMLCVSGICFTLINFAPFAKRERVKNYEDHKEKADLGQNNMAGPAEDKLSSNGSQSQIVLPEPNQALTRDNDGMDWTKARLTCCQFTTLISLIGLVNAITNGLIPSIQSYAALPYGNRAYTLAARLSTIANPLACFIALFITTSSVVVISVVALLGTVFSAYMLYLAFMSPFQPMRGTVEGEFLVILSAVLITGLCSFVKVVVAQVLQKEGRRALLWCGAVTQVGSLVGAVITFVLVNVLQLFQDMPACGFQETE